MCKKIAIVILNWNGIEDTLVCLKSCFSVDYPSLDVICVDNASSDGSAGRIRDSFDRAHLIVNSDNLGYAGGNNVGIRAALDRGAEYVLILNNDIVLDPAALGPLLDVFNKHADAGIVAPKVLYSQNPSLINSLGTSIDWFRCRPKTAYYHMRDNLEFPSVMEPQILLGCALMVHKRFVQDVGLLDESFFLIHEDADWCLRAKKKGYKTYVSTLSVVYHKESSTIQNYATLAHYYSVRNFLKLAFKSANFLNKIAVFFGMGYLMLKHLFWLITGESRVRRKGAAFFLAIYDFILFRSGRCQWSMSEQKT